MKSRRQFFKLAGTGVMAASVTSLYASSSLPDLSAKPADTFGLGIAGYTFWEIPFDKALEMMKRVGITNLSLKDQYLPMKSTQEEVNAVMTRFKNAGINVYTVGVVYMKSKEEVDRAFEYARMVGVKLIVGAPNYDLLPYVEEKVKKYDFKIAIHNHGPDNPLYPNATDIWNHIKDMDPRMGICLDIGHNTRDQQDPSVDMERYSKRIFDLHTKDVDKAAKEGKTVEIGRGIIDIPKFIGVLRKVKYSGMCSLEFEKDMKDPLPGIAESIGYFKGVMACK
jgi:inosose dehydratase